MTNPELPGSSPSTAAAAVTTSIASLRLFRSLLRQVYSQPPSTPADDDALATQLAHHFTVVRPALTASFSAAPPPSPSSRTLVSSGDSVTLCIPSHDLSPPTDLTLRLAPDFVTATLALSDALRLDELHAAALLYAARDLASRRPDKDVSVAAREDYAARREEAAAAVAELLRASIAWERAEVGPRAGDAVRAARDAMVVDAKIFDAAMVALRDWLAQTRPLPDSVMTGALANAAECIFLMAYTVQLTAAQAGDIADSMSQLASYVAALAEADSTSISTNPTLTRTQRTELDAASNLLLLAYMAGLDRSRYRDIYDPRTGTRDVNALLRDQAFVARTLRLQAFAPEQVPASASAQPQRDPAEDLHYLEAARELVGAVFRMASGDPPEQEARDTVLRVCVCAGAMHAFESSLPDWIEHGGGSLRIDAEVYAEVLEEFIFDLTEAPGLSQYMMNHARDWTRHLAAQAVEDLRQDQIQMQVEDTIGQNNLTASMAKAVSRAVSIFPGNLFTSSEQTSFGMLRYWQGVGSSPGIVPRLGDSVMDLADEAGRDPDSPGGVGVLFADALTAFLELLASISRPSVAHADAVVRFLAEGGHSLASIENMHAAVAHYTSALSSAAATGRPVRLGPAESDALAGIVTAVAQAASIMSEHGGITSFVGPDFPIRLASLATLCSSESLRVSVLRSLLLLDDIPSIVAFLESASNESCASLVAEIRINEPRIGSYAFTRVVLDLAIRAVKTLHSVPEPEQSHATLLSTLRAIVAFTLEEVLANWGRREYLSQHDRWALASSATELVWEARFMDVVVGILLTPAPGTGSASQALRTVASVAGMRASVDAADEGSAGGAALAIEAEDGNGRSLRHMEAASAFASQLLSFSISEASRYLKLNRKAPVAKPEELLRKETKSLVAIASLIGATSSCALHCARLVRDMVESSSSVASALVRDGSNTDFRRSLANLAAEDDVLHEENPDLLYTVLQIVSASLGTSGSGESGLFLLGVEVEEGERSSDYGVYGVLAGLCARLSSTPEIDSNRRASVALFIAFLCVSTASKTSAAVVDFLRAGQYFDSVKDILHGIVRTTREQVFVSKNWEGIGKLVEACCRLAALHARLYPPIDETIPSLVRNLLRVLTSLCLNGNEKVAARAFVGWKHLLATLLVAQRQRDDDTLAPLLSEIAEEVLEGLGGTNEVLSRLFSADAGQGAADVALLCIARIRSDLTTRPAVRSPIGPTQIGNLLVRIAKALSGGVPSHPDAPSARASLFVGLIHCYELLRVLTPREQGTIGSGVLIKESLSLSAGIGANALESVLTTASKDAISGAPASRAAAMSACAVLLQVDSLHGHETASTLLGSNNRFRKLIMSVLTDSRRGSVVRALSDDRHNGIGQGGQSADDSAVLFLTEIVLTAISSLSRGPKGLKIIAESGAVEAISDVLQCLSLVNIRRPFETDMGLSVEETGDGQGYITENNIQMSHRNKTARFSSIVGTICSILSAVASNSSFKDVVPNKVVVSCLESGQSVFSSVIRLTGSENVETLKAAADIGLLLSLLDNDDIGVVGPVTQLQTLSAQQLGTIVSTRAGSLDLADMDSGLSLREGDFLKPSTPREGRRARVAHPKGGSLFERDVVRAKVECLRGLLSAVRTSQVFLSVFDPTLERQRSAPASQRTASVGDIAFVAAACLSYALKCNNECSGLLSLATQAQSSLPSRRIAEWKPFCNEEYQIDPTDLSSVVLSDCLTKASSAARETCDICLVVIESCLFILREFCRHSVEIFRGEFQRDGQSFGLSDARQLLEEFPTTVMPICRKIESHSSELWGERDPAFVRQMGRDIRTFVSRRS